MSPAKISLARRIASARPAAAPRTTMQGSGSRSIEIWVSLFCSISRTIVPPGPMRRRTCSAAIGIRSRHPWSTRAERASHAAARSSVVPVMKQRSLSPWNCTRAPDSFSIFWIWRPLAPMSTAWCSRPTLYCSCSTSPISARISWDIFHAAARPSTDPRTTITAAAAVLASWRILDGRLGDISTCDRKQMAVLVAASIFRTTSPPRPMRR
mmetsp:Transcript_6304/g.15273  ORF Transcript_6304/g.15273 Transcript_6304/m.15273 type:complete len:210 (-) Transcript_6304:2626-3255(-)